MIGHEAPSHQIGVVTSSKFRKWYMADSDAAMHGIGRIEWNSSKNNMTSDLLKKMPFIRISGKLHTFSPNNITVECATQNQKCDKIAGVNTHCVYRKVRNKQRV